MRRAPRTKRMRTSIPTLLLGGLLLVGSLMAGCRGTSTPEALTPTSKPLPRPSPTRVLQGPELIPTPLPEESTWKQIPLLVRRFYLTTRQGRTLLFIEAMLPTPCHEARAQVQAQPGRLQVDLFAVMPPEEAVCVQVLSYLSGYVDLTPWLEADPEAQVWLGNQQAPVQEGLAPPITPPTTPPSDTSPSSGGHAMTTIPTPDPKETAWQVGPFHLESARLEYREAAWVLVVSGTLPTPCHQVRHRVALEGTRLQVDIFTVRDPGVMCVQVLQPFSGEVDLTPWARQHPGVEVWVNGQRVGKLDSTQE